MQEECIVSVNCHFELSVNCGFVVPFMLLVQNTEFFKQWKAPILQGSEVVTIQSYFAKSHKDFIGTLLLCWVVTAHVFTVFNRRYIQYNKL